MTEQSKENEFCIMLVNDQLLSRAPLEKGKIYRYDHLAQDARETFLRHIKYGRAVPVSPKAAEKTGYEIITFLGQPDAENKIHVSSGDLGTLSGSAKVRFVPAEE